MSVGLQLSDQSLPYILLAFFIVGGGLCGLGKEQPRLDQQELYSDGQELDDLPRVNSRQFLDVLKVLIGDQGKGHLSDVQFPAFNQLQQQVEGTLEDGQTNLVGRGDLLLFHYSDELG